MCSSRFGGVGNDDTELPCAAAPRIRDEAGVVAVNFNYRKTKRGKELRKIREQLDFMSKIVRLKLIDVNYDREIAYVTGAHCHQRLVNLALLHFAVAKDNSKPAGCEK